ncbi:hypothetical protein [Haliangium sp.]|uniref:hypothetical protein n=1 Tax=Haliangium sp. TaxID=2663208 RepID=UPI003D1506E8
MNAALKATAALAAVVLTVTLPAWETEARADTTLDTQEAQASPMLDRTQTTTAAVGTGIKTVLAGVGFQRDARLQVEVNPSAFTTYDDIKSLSQAYKRRWFNPLFLSILVEAAPVGGDSGHASKLGAWRLGGRWAIYDQTSIFHPDAVRRLRERATASLEQLHLAIETTDEDRDALWNRMRPITWAALAAEGRTPQEIKAALQEIHDRRGELNCKQSKAVPIPNDYDELEIWTDWEDEWYRICEPRIDAALTRKAKDSLDEAERSIGNGLVISAESFLVGDAEVVPAMDPDADPKLDRHYGATSALRVTWRWFSSSYSLDLSANAVEMEGGVADGLRMVRHGASASVALWPGLWHDNGVVFSLEGEGTSWRHDGAERELTLKQSISFPLDESVFLGVALSENWSEDTPWDSSLSFSLAWSWQRGREVIQHTED